MKIKKTYIALGAVIALFGSSIVFSEPGSESDPLVTLSYVNNSIEQLKIYVDNRFNSNSGSSVSELEVVEVPAGRFLLGKANTEIILRSGNATAIVSDLGGLLDVTGGVDIGRDEPIPSNHLLIIPRDDGRGVYVTNDAFFMIRGEYEIR
ncbi:MAG: hypothetical protein PHY91_06920 [Tissierellia bacterium]|nr:hypothetical protein [Tissierellia bacterium]MDD4725858.1 hypothetical protein [Tissierellia bacterium]